ncbi:SdpI family protein [Alkalibacter mobilis]|uniref:SdpI family protein n=1 Tax=Alkalibacter mobilis TaxID=2787712 RepID=UPI00189DAB3C|nr:SdpI family protein [Alkalibacter mobilis]MBF7095909.1 SdpI family protein [Alkalibacter mobilis]
MTIKRLINWILALTPIVITLIVLPVLPDKIPAHYGFDGNVTRFGSKYELLIMPIITIGIFLLWLLLEKHLMKDKEKGAHNSRGIFWISIVMTFTFAMLQVVFLYSAYRGVGNLDDFDYQKIIAVALSASWIVIGNVLPKLKQNGLVGIRTPWTLASENNWYKTHRMGGKLAVVTGTISGLLCLFVFSGEVGIWVSLGSSIAMLVPIAIYSYLVYKREG